MACELLPADLLFSYSEEMKATSTVAPDLPSGLKDAVKLNVCKPWLPGGALWLEKKDGRLLYFKVSQLLREEVVPWFRLLVFNGGGHTSFLSVTVDAN